MQQSPIALLVLFLWIPTVLYLFWRFPPQRAIVVSFVVAWLFLPVAKFPLPGLPDLTKMSATCYGVLLATCIYDAGRFSSFKPGWLDLPMLIWCVCPFASSIANDLGPYDGFSATLEQILTWGVPYFLGRLYLSNLAGMKQLAIGIFTGGVTYIPLCLFEIRLSPQLHRIVYGYHASGDFSQTMRYGGYRPTVFMEHGLAVGAWMMAATLTGIWLWKTGVIKQLWNIPIEWLVVALLITFVLCKSTGAYFMLVLGLILLFSGKWFRTALPVFLLIVSICSYLFVSAETETYFTDQIVSSLSRVVGAERVQSLEFRFNNEELLVDKARDRIMFGWGGWGRALIFDEQGNQLTVQDSLWIIAFGHFGRVGLVSLTALMLLPVASLFGLRYPARSWSKREVASAAVLAAILVLYMLDCVLNAMINPIFILTSGGISGLALKTRETSVKHIRSSVAARHVV